MEGSQHIRIKDMQRQAKIAFATAMDAKTWVSVPFF